MLTTYSRQLGKVANAEPPRVSDDVQRALDATGKVTNTWTDVENTKAACFRTAYAGVQFPKPPIAPYRKAILLK